VGVVLRCPPRSLGRGLARAVETLLWVSSRLGERAVLPPLHTAVPGTPYHHIMLRMHTHTHTHKHTCADTCAHTHTHTHIHTHTHTHTHTQCPFILYIENDKRKARAMFSDQMKMKASHLHWVNYECVFGLPTSAPNRKTSSCISSKLRVGI